MPAAEARPRVLFLCTGNSCRSRMAETFARALKGDVLQASSAGTHPEQLDPRAARVMAEAGFDVAAGPGRRPEDVGGPFDWVVTICDAARASCPALPGATRIVHRPFDDPPRLARDARDDDEALSHYRRVRDEIRAFIETLPESLPLLLDAQRKAAP